MGFINSIGSLSFMAVLISMGFVGLNRFCYAQLVLLGSKGSIFSSGSIKINQNHTYIFCHLNHL